MKTKSTILPLYLFQYSSKINGLWTSRQLMKVTKLHKNYVSVLLSQYCITKQNSFHLVKSLIATTAKNGNLNILLAIQYIPAYATIHSCHESLQLNKRQATHILPHKQHTQCRYNVNTEVCAYYCYCGEAASITYSEYVCGLSYPVCKEHVPYYIATRSMSGSAIFFHIISQTAWISEKRLLNIKHVFQFSLQLLSETLLILRRI
jgi:hypothetical protein